MGSSQIEFGETAILDRVLKAEKPAYSVELAREILALGFSREDEERMNRLAALAREGALSPQERAEIDDFERIGRLLNFLQIRARSSLKAARAISGESESG